MANRNVMSLPPEVWRGLMEKKALIGTGVVLSGKLVLGKSVEIWHYATVGFASEEKVEVCELVSERRRNSNVTSLGHRSIIRPYALIERGAEIGDDVEISEFSRIGPCTSIGDGSIIEYGAKIYEKVSIGKDSIVGGFSCNDSKIGSATTMMGILVHRYPRNLTSKEWNETKERPAAPVIGNNVLVGFNAVVIGEVEVGDGARIGAGAIVTKDVPKGKYVKNGYLFKK